MFVLIDNYDSFTYNLYQYLVELSSEPVQVVRNDQMSVDDILALQPAGIIISPGPGRPEQAGISLELVQRCLELNEQAAENGQNSFIRILGVCLGHQVIAVACGGRVKNARHIVHGKTRYIELDGKGLFRSIPSPALFTRYHSLAVDRASLEAAEMEGAKVNFPGGAGASGAAGREAGGAGARGAAGKAVEDPIPNHRNRLEITAWSDDGEIMGLRHKVYPVEGVQFHPESVASQYGKQMIRNFINYRREPFGYKPVLTKVTSRQHMTLQEAQGFMDDLTEGNLTDVQIAGFLTAINTKGIAAEEIAGCAGVLRKKRIPVQADGPVLDTCGTGGDGLGTFNISSLAALVAAACGVKVAKHGNRAVSSLSGSADFFREIGVPVQQDPKTAEAMLNRCGFAFLFAPKYHGAMRHAAKARQELGIKTVMNVLGPLANPAGAEYQLIGVFSEELCTIVAGAAIMLGAKRVMVVHGQDGQDEISVTGPSRMVVADETGGLTDRLFEPQEAGIGLHLLHNLVGGTAEENAAIGRTILGLNQFEVDDKDNNDADRLAAIRDAVLLNAGAAVYLYGKADSISAGTAAAREALESGAAGAKLLEVSNFTLEKETVI